MSTGKTYSTKYLLDSNNNRGAEGQVLSTTSTGIDWVDANTVPGTGLWLANGNDIYNSNSGNVAIARTNPGARLDIKGVGGMNGLTLRTTDASDNETFYIKDGGTVGVRYPSFKVGVPSGTANLANTRFQIATTAGDIVVLDDGKTGIGTTLPGYKLEVAGNITAKNNADVFVNSIVSSGSTTGRSFIKNVGDTGSVLVSAVYGSATTGTLFGISATRAASIVTTSDTSVHPTSLIIGTFTGIPLYLGTNNSSRITILANGNVGIGTTSPDTRLEVRGGSGSGEHAHATFTGTANRGLKISTTDVPFGQNSGTVLYDAQDGEGYGEHHWQIAGTTKMVLNKDGNVGIGTTSPTGYRLVVENTSEDLLKLHNSTDGLDSLISFTNPGGTLGRIQGIDNGGLGFDVGNNAGGIVSNAMFIKNNGDVGIGTTNPVGDLHLYGGQQNIVLTNTAADGVAGLTISRIIGQARGYSNNLSVMQSIDFVTNATAWYKGDIVFRTNDIDGTDTTKTAAERMRILANGNVGIGTDDPSAKLHIASSVNLDGILLTGDGSGSGMGTNQGRSIDFQYTATDSSFGSAIRFSIPNNTVHGGALTFHTDDTVGTLQQAMVINQAQNVGIGTTGPSAKTHIIGDNSEWALKVENTQALPYGLSVNTTGTAGTTYNSAFYTHSGTGMFIVNNGNVGIGTTSPNAPLEVHGADITTRANTTAQSVLRLVRDVTDSNYTSTKDSAVDFMLSRQQTVNNNLPYTRLDIRLAGTTDSSTPSLDVMSLLHNGSVGIGTTSPTYDLDVNGDIRARENIRVFGNSLSSIPYNAPSETSVNIGTYLNDFGWIDISSSNSGGGWLDFSKADGGDYAGRIRYVNSTDQFQISTNNSQKMVIESGGNVGIGTTDAIYKLDVVSTGDGLLSLKGGNKPVMRFMVGTSTVGTIQAQENTSLNVSAYGTSSLNLQTAGTVPRLTILTGGNVGIGTTSPVQPLQVNGTVLFRTTTADGSKNRFQLIPGGSSDAANLYLYYGNTGDGSLGVRINAQGNSYFNGGNVGIGVTGPSSLLEIEGATNSSTSNLLRLSRATQGSTPEKVAGFYSGTSGEKGYITVNNFGTAYNTSSDYRLKENIKPIDNSVERLMSLKPCNFNFISKDEDKVVMDGFIAHEAKEVVPEAVTGIKDAVDEKGNPAYQGIDQSKLVPLLTAALQEALQRIEILEQKINN